MSTVVVTGGCGFIGSHVVTKLERSGKSEHRVAILDRVHEEHPVELCDMGKADLPDDTVGVVHCAAHADVRDNWAPGRLSEIVRDNGIALRALLDACSTTALKAFVFISTAAVYAEEMSPYAASKLSGEAWCKAYAAKFGWNLTIVRPAACFGRGYHHGHVADFVAQAKATGKVAALTRGAPRDGLHVEDLAEKLAAIATDAKTYAPRTFYMRGVGQWSCRDTVRLMGVEASWTDVDRGWLGDGAAGGEQVNAALGERDIADGVRDALVSLGWPS